METDEAALPERDTLPTFDLDYEIDDTGEPEVVRLYDSDGSGDEGAWISMPFDWTVSLEIVR